MPSSLALLLALDCDFRGARPRKAAPRCGAWRSLRLGGGEPLSTYALSSLQALNEARAGVLAPGQLLACSFRLRAQALTRPSLAGRQFASDAMPVAPATAEAQADARSEAKAFAKENIMGFQTSSHGCRSTPNRAALRLPAAASSHGEARRQARTLLEDLGSLSRVIYRLVDEC